LSLKEEGRSIIMQNTHTAGGTGETADPWQDCVTQCWTCRNECQKIFFTHCLEEGGPHLEKDHVRIMMDCIEVCQAAADSMVRLSPSYAAICAACASVCEACADSCDSIESEMMRQLGAACRACAAACRRMSLGGEGEPALSLHPYAGSGQGAS
jgi:hypothetical protein